MAIPLGFIATAINLFKDSKVGKLPLPGASQTFGEATASKTGVAIMTIIGFSATHIQSNPESSAGWIMLGLCVLAATLGDRIDKVYKILKEDKDNEE